MPSTSVRVGQFLQGSSAVQVSLIFDALGSADPPQIDPPQTAFQPLTNGLLLDIYCLIHSRVRDLGSSSITSRLAQTLYYLGCSPQPTSEIAKRWSKEATKLQDVFIRQRKTKYNKTSTAVYLAARPTFQPLQEQLDQVCATWLCLSLLVLIIVRFRLCWRSLTR